MPYAGEVMQNVKKDPELRAGSFFLLFFVFMFKIVQKKVY